LASGIRFGFGYTIRLRAFCLDVWESIANAGIRDSFGIEQLSGKLGEKRKHCKVSVKTLEVGGCRSGVFVSFVSPGVVTAEGDSHGYDVFDVDIYSCLRWLVS